MTVLRYTHQNPIKAGIVKDTREYKWSSYSEYISKAEEVDTDFILDIINNNRKKATIDFIEFHKKESDTKCLDIKEKRRIKDDEAKEIIKRICSLLYCIDLQKLNEGKRSKYIKILKEKGLSIRQIARLTGISRHIIIKS